MVGIQIAQNMFAGPFGPFDNAAQQKTAGCSSGILARSCRQCPMVELAPIGVMSPDKATRNPRTGEAQLYRSRMGRRDILRGIRRPGVVTGCDDCDAMCIMPNTRAALPEFFSRFGAPQ
ncbi:hypothetical protein [Cupriavidus plantarum]|uniref:hypothetical protein n=1 Tax=Cupriavidus plantarum TaxID=942865 RepID=UPI00339DA180